MSRGKGAGGEGREQVEREGSRWRGKGAGGVGMEQVEREGSRWRGKGAGGEGWEEVERVGSLWKDYFFSNIISIFISFLIQILDRKN